MAGADYRDCIVCGKRAYYEADLQDKDDYWECSVNPLCSQCRKKWSVVAIRKGDFGDLKASRIKYKGGYV